MKKRLSEEEAAKFCGMHVDTFRKRIKEGKGPKFKMFGKRRKYLEDTLVDWMEKDDESPSNNNVAS